MSETAAIQFDEEGLGPSLEARLKDDLGIPPDIRLERIVFNPAGRNGWVGHVLAVYGIRVSWPWPAEDVKPDWPHVLISDAAGNVKYCWQLWLQHAWKRASAVMAERRWHPDRGVTDSIIGLAAPHTRDDVLDAWRAIDMINHAQRFMSSGGRRRLEEEADAGKLELANVARELRRKRWQWRRIVTHLDVVDYDDYTDDLEGCHQAERAAIERVKYWIKRCEKIEQQQ